jgi:predicted  nucleic acid-binding Zn-ribbon protein
MANMNTEIERLRGQRAEVASGIDVRELDEYERRRISFGGVAVAEIKGGVCGGCHMDISISEIDAIKRLPVDAVAECPNCSRLLVR